MIDIEALQKDVEDILVFSQDYPFDLNAKELISEWKNAKQDFINLFNGETFVRSKDIIKVRLTKEQRRKRFDEFIGILEETMAIPDEFKSFLQENQEGFFKNKVVAPKPEYRIERGAKLSKAFRKFFSELATVRWIQDTASRFMQEDKIEGYLYLSVDPKDFLTISENNSDWWSCHTLDGEYRAGNLNYMTDEVTLVAYLASDEQEHLRCLPMDMVWNNKKWRMLIHTNGDSVVYYDRQYPYTSGQLLIEVYKMLNVLYKFKFVAPYDYGYKTVVNYLGHQRITQTNQIYVQGRSFDTRDLLDTRDYLGYCDIISSNSFTPTMSLSRSLYSYLMSKNNINREDEGYISELSRARSMYGLKIGGKVPCVCCGKEFIERDTSFLCPYCIAEHDADEDFFLSCDGCGHRIYDEDGVFWKDDGYGNELAYCKHCHQEMINNQEE